MSLRFSRGGGPILFLFAGRGASLPVARLGPLDRIDLQIYVRVYGCNGSWSGEFDSFFRLKTRWREPGSFVLGDAGSARDGCGQTTTVGFVDAWRRS